MQTVTRSFSGAAECYGRYLSVPLFGGTKPSGNTGGVPAQGITSPAYGGAFIFAVLRGVVERALEHALDAAQERPFEVDLRA